MKEKLGDLARLHHVEKRIADLELILQGVDEDVFYRNTEKKYAVERILEIIGEAINNISPDTLAKSKDVIPWRDIVDFRNLVTHEYFRVDYTMVYNIATEEIPKLKTEIHFLIKELQD